MSETISPKPIDAVPSVIDQGFPVCLLKGPLGGYNSGLLEREDGQLWLLSRVFEFEPVFRSKLVWQRVLQQHGAEQKFNVEPLGELKIPKGGEAGLTELSNAEDARVV